MTSSGKPPGYVRSATGVIAPMSSQWPVIVSLPGPQRVQPAVDDGRVRGRAAAQRERGAEPEALEVREVEAARRLGDVAERVRPRVAVLGGVGELPGAAGVQDDDEGAPVHGRRNASAAGQASFARGCASK